MTDRPATRSLWTPSLPALVMAGIAAIAMGFAWLAIPDAPPLLGISAGMLALAGVAATPRRWTAPVAGVLGATLVVIGSFAQPFTAYHLARPWTPDFAATLVLLSGGAVAGIAGVAAGFHAASRPDRRTWPAAAWGLPLVTALIGALAGATAFGNVAYDARPRPDAGLAGARAQVVVARDMSFVEAPTELPSGRSVIELRNEGELEHDFTIAEGGDEPVVVAPPGQIARGAIELDAGTYTYYCSIPGHREAGMEGTLTVTG